MGLADTAALEGNWKLQSDIENSFSLRKTRSGQEIAALRGRYTEDSPHAYIEKVLSTRLNRLGKSITGDLKDEVNAKKMSTKKAAVEKIDRQVANLTKKLEVVSKAEAMTLDVQKFIDDLICT